MKKLIATLLFAVPFIASPALAADKPSKLSECRSEAKAKGLKGQERKDFLKECMPRKKAAKSERSPKQIAHQEKFKACNAEAKGMKGAEHKAFIKECMKK